jgi:hypothetical protein
VRSCRVEDSKHKGETARSIGKRKLGAVTAKVQRAERKSNGTTKHDGWQHRSDSFMDETERGAQTSWTVHLSVDRKMRGGGKPEASGRSSGLSEQKPKTGTCYLLQ